MKKHFLLLVMAMMSLASWAATDISGFAIRTNSVQYGTAIAKTDIKVYDADVITSGSNILDVSSYDWNGKVYSDAACTAEVTASPLPKGTYYVKVTGTGAYNGEATTEIEIVKKEIYVQLSWTASGASAASVAQLSKTYGDPDPEFEIDYTGTGFVGTDTKSVVTGTAALAEHVNNAGTQDIVLTGLTADNYIIKLNPTYTPAGATTAIDFTKMNITPKTLPTQADGVLAYTTTYQGKLIEPKYNIVDGTVTLTEGKAASGTTAATGDYSIAYTGTGATVGINASTSAYNVTITGQNNYKGTLTGTVLINKAPLSVYVKDIKVPYAGKEYGVDDNKIKKVISYTTSGTTSTPVYSTTGSEIFAPEFVYTGYVGNDLAASIDPSTASTYVPTTTPTIAITLGTGEKALNVKDGNYPLEVTVPTGCTLTNYDITALNGTAVSGKLVIEPYQLTVTASTTTQNIGEAEKTIGYTLDFSDFQTLTPATATTPAVMEKAFTTEPVFQKTDGKNVGKYAISVKTEGVTSSNFAVKKYVVTAFDEDGKIATTTGNPVYTIAAATVNVVVLPHEKVYGEADPESLENPVVGVDYVVAGIEDTSVLTGVKLVRSDDSETAGTYSLTADFSALGDNFIVTNTPGTFTIKKKALKVTALAQTLSIGDDDTKLNKNLRTIDSEKGLAGEDAADNVFKLAFRTADAYAEATGITAFETGVTYYERSGSAGSYSYTATTATTPASGTTYYIKSYEKVDFTSGASTLSTAKTYAGGIIVELVTTGTGALGANYELDFVPGQLIVVDATSTIVLNRVAKADFADETKNDAVAVITAAAAIPTGATAPAKKTVTFSDFKLLPEKWYPIVLPFDTDVKEVSSLFGYAVVNVLSKNQTPDAIRFKLHMQDLPANEPFVVKVSEEINMNSVKFPAKTIVKSDDPSVQEGNVKFIGSYTGKIGFTANQRFFSTAEGKNDYYFGSETNTTYLRPLGAYFEVPEGYAARLVIFEEADGSATAIQGVKTQNEASNAEGWYTIGGVKLNGAPSQKGIYIQNGKKVVVK